MYVEFWKIELKIEKNRNEKSSLPSDSYPASLPPLQPIWCPLQMSEIFMPHLYKKAYESWYFVDFYLFFFIFLG